MLCVAALPGRALWEAEDRAGQPLLGSKQGRRTRLCGAHGVKSSVAECEETDSWKKKESLQHTSNNMCITSFRTDSCQELEGLWRICESRVKRKLLQP